MKQGLRGTRRGLAIALYSLASLGVVLGVLIGLAVWASTHRSAATGDLTGASLGTAFLLMGLLPLTLAAVLLALWLAPPNWVRRRGDDVESSQEAGATPSPRARSPHVMLVIGLLVAGATLAGIVGIMLVDALQGARQYYGARGSGLIGLAIQDLVLFSPLILLAGVLFLIAGTMARRGRRPE